MLFGDDFQEKGTCQYYMDTFAGNRHKNILLCYNINMENHTNHEDTVSFNVIKEVPV